MVDRIKALCDKMGTNFSAVEKELGFANASIKKTNPNTAVSRISALAKYFDVSMEYIYSGAQGEHVAKDEAELLSLYRSMNSAGRATLINLLRTMASTPEYQNVKKLSDSEIA